MREATPEEAAQLAALRLQWLGDLEALLKACDVFEAEQGYYGEGILYSKPPYEAPWRAAVKAGGEVFVRSASNPLVASLAKGTDVDFSDVFFDAIAVAAAIRELVTACDSYWNGADEGSRGKSLYSPDLDAKWKAARKVAKAVFDENLADLKVGPLPLKLPVP